jgi:hypothetical protein
MTQWPRAGLALATPLRVMRQGQMLPDCQHRHRRRSRQLARQQRQVVGAQETSVQKFKIAKLALLNLL